MTDQTAPAVVQTGTLPLPAGTLPVVRAAPPARCLWPWALGAATLLGAGALAVLQPWADRPPEVAVETVIAGPVTRILAVNGRVASALSVEVRPMVSGTLTEVAVAEGATVQAGDLLARIDAAAQGALLRQALASLDAALVAEAEARATLTRTAALGENTTRVVLDAATTALQIAAQDVARGTALLDAAQIELSRYTLLAPIAGAVLDLTAKPGQRADPATPLLTLIDPARLLVETDVDESRAAQIRLDQPAALQLSGESTVRDGHVSFVSQRVEPGTGGLAIRLTPDLPITAPVGLTVTANITVESRALALTVPRAAILRGAEGDRVLILQDGVAVARPVTVIDWPAARLIVTEGLAEGDVVIGDATGLVTGQAVTALP